VHQKKQSADGGQQSTDNNTTVVQLSVVRPPSLGTKTGETEMARFEIADVECAALGEAPTSADTFFDLGMMYSVGRNVPIDFVTAHKWFNLAALRGNAEATRLRREIAEQMSEAEIAQAQRAARAWLKAS
jgi:hypothetical protein